MAAEYDERFDELTGLVRKVAGSVDEIQLEMRDTRKEMRDDASQNTSRFDALETGLQLVSGRQNDVIPKVIDIQKDVNRISETQSEHRRMNDFDGRIKQMDSNVKEIRETINVLIDPILDGKPVWPSVSQIEERIARLEEKLSS